MINFWVLLLILVPVCAVLVLAATAVMRVWWPNWPADIRDSDHYGDSADGDYDPTA